MKSRQSGVDCARSRVGSWCVGSRMVIELIKESSLGFELSLLCCELSNAGMLLTGIKSRNRSLRGW